jgi:hypothetical protein
MIVASEIRCSECLDEFGDGARYAVVKEDTSNAYSDEERSLGGHLYQVLVCEDCANWYDYPVLASLQGSL